MIIVLFFNRFFASLKKQIIQSNPIQCQLDWIGLDHILTSDWIGLYNLQYNPIYIGSDENWLQNTEQFRMDENWLQNTD